MLKIDKAQIAMMLLAAGLIGYACGPAAAAVHIDGQVQAGGGPLASSTVTLWAASCERTQQLAQAKPGMTADLRLAPTRRPGKA